jgi:hypothetical protein
MRDFGSLLADALVTVTQGRLKKCVAVNRIDKLGEYQLIEDANSPKLNFRVTVAEEVDNPRKCSPVCDDAEKFHSAAADRKIARRGEQLPASKHGFPRMDEPEHRPCELAPGLSGDVVVDSFSEGT